MIRSFVKRRITVSINRRNKKLTFKNIAPFRSCTSKTNNTFADNAEDLDIIMSKCNLLECSDKYSMTSGSLWNYNRDEVMMLLIKLLLIVG